MGIAEIVYFSVAIRLNDIEMHMTNPYEFKRSQSFSDLGKRSFRFNILKSFLSETKRLVQIPLSNLLITMTGIDEVDI